MDGLVNKQGRQNEQTTAHSGVVMETLTGALGETTMQFTKILEIRTEVRVSFCDMHASLAPGHANKTTLIA